MRQGAGPAWILERVLTIVVAATLFAMMALTFVDVASRKVLGVIVPGSVELTELLMLAVVFAGLPLASLKGEHVLFDLLDPLLPRPLRRLQERIANAACALAMAGAAYLVWKRAGRTLELGDVTPQLGIGIAGFHYGIAVLLAVTAVVHLLLMRDPQVGDQERTT